MMEHKNYLFSVPDMELSILLLILQWPCARPFYFLVEDTAAAINVEDKTTLISLNYDTGGITPNYCEDRLKYFSAALLDIRDRTNHRCLRLGTEFNLYITAINNFLKNLESFCTKITKVKLLEDNKPREVTPTCEITISSLAFLKDRLKNLANLITSFTVPIGKTGN